jgi:hypothetical protein
MKSLGHRCFRAGPRWPAEHRHTRLDYRMEEKMTTTRRLAFGLACAILLIQGHLMVDQASARPRPPGPPYPEVGVLASFPFDNPNQFTNTSQVIQNAALVESWSGYALSMEGEAPQGSWLFLDGQLAATGQPVNLAPPQNSGGTFGLFLGTDVAGGNLANGQFDELTTFRTVQTADDLAWNYSCLAGCAALGPITLEEDAVWLARAAGMSGAGRTGEQMLMSSNVKPPPWKFGTKSNKP